MTLAAMASPSSPAGGLPYSIVYSSFHNRPVGSLACRRMRSFHNRHETHLGRMSGTDPAWIPLLESLSCYGVRWLTQTPAFCIGAASLQSIYPKPSTTSGCDCFDDVSSLLSSSILG
ncbi:hypothetical protein Nepgr_029941 [Nepenthes gracilis]|uniref:Uncharacterized protein n=1 Tax=Nepenthes gracilis TaxID=150966 RepID=A0AAD3TDH3_NEPGR|nr:hypothetical protein Nepgr_029941 [Nepenthes gracilis]